MSNPRITAQKVLEQSPPRRTYGLRRPDFRDQEAFSVREFCERFGICRQTFYNQAKHGHIKARKLGRKTVILRSDAEAWLESLPALELAATA
jgi:excisionase family DNA binding protein